MDGVLNIFRRTPAQSRAAGYSDGRHFISMYRAYLSGALQAADEDAHDRSALILCAMLLAFVAWTTMMVLVFRS